MTGLTDKASTAKLCTKVVNDIELREPNISNLQWRVDKLVMRSKAKATNDTDIIVHSDKVNVEGHNDKGDHISRLEAYKQCSKYAL